jgi:hypothetical protein
LDKNLQKLREIKTKSQFNTNSHKSISKDTNVPIENKKAGKLVSDKYLMNKMMSKKNTHKLG